MTHLHLDNIGFAEGTQVILIQPFLDAIRMEYVFIIAGQLCGVIVLHKLRAAYGTSLFLVRTVVKCLLFKRNHIEIDLDLILPFTFSEVILEDFLAEDEEDDHVSHAKDCEHAESDEYSADVC